MNFWIKNLTNTFNFKLKYHLFNQIPRVDDFKWILGPPPSFKLWVRFWSQNIKRGHLDYKSISKNSTLINLNQLLYNDITTLKDRVLTEDSGAIKIRYNREYENEFLKETNIEQNPIESMQIRLVTEIEAQNVCSKIIYGDLSAVSSLKEIFKLIQKTIATARSHGLSMNSIKMVEINHIHPTLELIAMDDYKFKYIFSSLSKRDIEVAQILKSSVERHPLLIKAIIPSGINYNYVFR
ncbi:MAG: hypothetical protein HQK49_20085 [Oligoflexia bacterium]|nr:hypothetical protein [Oligoflexia bacterium]